MKTDLTTQYLGLTLRSPLVPSASPRSERVRDVEHMADAGAAAVVFHSLFSEQCARGGDPSHWKITPTMYCQHLSAARARVDIPLIASLNVSTAGGGLSAARWVEDAGADAIEVNLYRGPDLSEEPSSVIEDRAVDAIGRIRQMVKIPIAVKLTPYYSNLHLLVRRLSTAGADGFVLFTRFSQPDLGTQTGDRFLPLPLTNIVDMQLPMHWIATLSRQIPRSFAATGGIQRATDVVRMAMAGAHVTMLCSVLLRRGITYLAELEHDLVEWMNDVGYTNISEFHGCLSFSADSRPDSIERKNYIRMLTHSEHELDGFSNGA